MPNLITADKSGQETLKLIAHDAPNRRSDYRSSVQLILGVNSTFPVNALIRTWNSVAGRFIKGSAFVAGNGAVILLFRTNIEV